MATTTIQPQTVTRTIQLQSFGPRQLLSQMAQLNNFSGYLQSRSQQESRAANSPTATGIYQRRDARTGQAIMNTPSGGRLRANEITSGAIAKGSVVPRLTASSRGTGYADSMAERR